MSQLGLGQKVGHIGYPNRSFEIVELMAESRFALDDGEILVYCFGEDIVL